MKSELSHTGVKVCLLLYVFKKNVLSQTFQEDINEHLHNLHIWGLNHRKQQIT
jgi:hypothetical protein